MNNTQFNLKDPIHLLAVGFGSGLLKPGPGTWGTLMAVPIYYLLAQLPFVLFLSVLVVAMLAGVYICGKSADDIGVHDHGSIVWDEFVGYWITMALITWQLGTPHIIWAAVGFLLFRIFDIVKPFPIGWLDKRVHGGFGIMLDDIIAGFYALGCLYFAMWYYLEHIVDIKSPI